MVYYMVCYMVYYLLMIVMNNTENTEFSFANMLEMWVIFSSESLVLLLSYLLVPQPFKPPPPCRCVGGGNISCVL